MLQLLARVSPTLVIADRAGSSVACSLELFGSSIRTYTQIYTLRSDAYTVQDLAGLALLLLLTGRIGGLLSSNR